MTQADFNAKWDKRFKDNDSFDISEADLREFKDDLFLVFGAGGVGKRYIATESVGGIRAGDPFTTADPAVKQMLVTYQLPGFDYLFISGQPSRTVPVGTLFVDGSKPVTWRTRNSTNVKANSLQFWDVTAQAMLASNEADDGQLQVSTASFRVGLGLSRHYRLTGQNTEGNFFTADLVVQGQHVGYFGYSGTNGPLTMAQLIGLGNAEMQPGRNRTVGGVTAGAGLYTVYAWPSDGKDDIGQVLQDGVDSIRGAFGPVRYATGNNALGVPATLAYIISNASKAFTNSALSFA